MAKAKRKLSAYNRFIARELKGKSGAGHKGRFKAAVAKWKRSSGRTKSPRRKVSGPVRRASRPRARAKPKSTGGRKMAGFNTQKLMKYVRLAALVAPAASAAMRPVDARTKLAYGLRSYTGWDINKNSFDARYLAEGWTPYLASIAVTYGIPKLAGIIRGL